MPQLFAVTRFAGPQWDHARKLEQQRDWRAHADFMNDLEAEGFVVLGGPLDGAPDTLLIIRAENPRKIEERLSADCWARSGQLRIGCIASWDLRLGSLSRSCRA
jgi:hypothetical protein